MEDNEEYIITNFIFGVTVAIMFGLIMYLLLFGSPLHDLCGSKACITTGVK